MKIYKVKNKFDYRYKFNAITLKTGERCLVKNCGKGIHREYIFICEIPRGRHKPKFAIKKNNKEEDYNFVNKILC